MQKIEEAVVALNVAENVSYIRATRKQGIHGFNERIFIRKEALMPFRLCPAARGPWLNACNVVACAVACFEGMEKMDQVAAPFRCVREFAWGPAHD